MDYSYAGKLFNQSQIQILRDGFVMARFEGREVKNQGLYNFVMKKIRDFETKEETNGEG